MIHLRNKLNNHLLHVVVAYHNIRSMKWRNRKNSITNTGTTSKNIVFTTKWT